VDCIALDGLELWFNSNDHGPPHFHALRLGEFELRIFFLACTDEHLEYELKRGKKPASRMRKQLRDLVVENREKLLHEWDRKVCRE
jgi:hypothetical protein